jgi:hypothetical protein
LTTFAIESLDEGFIEDRTHQRAMVLLRGVGVGMEIEVNRVGLNLAQVREHDLPPNYAKDTDRRFPAYVEEFGTRECWELDALEPTVIDRLLRAEIESYVDMRKWRAAKRKEKANRETLSRVAKSWDSVAPCGGQDEHCCCCSGASHHRCKHRPAAAAEDSRSWRLVPLRILRQRLVLRAIVGCLGRGRRQMARAPWVDLKRIVLPAEWAPQHLHRINARR